MRPCVDSSGPADWCQFAGVGRRSPPASLQCRPAESTPVRRAYLLSMEASASPSLGHSEQISTRIFSAGKGHLKSGGGEGEGDGGDPGGGPVDVFGSRDAAETPATHKRTPR